MIKSKTKIEKQLKKKTNSQLVRTIIAAKKNNKWLEIAGILASPRKNQPIINLQEISNIKDEKILVITGKVLSQGELNKKRKIVALNFSEKAKEKILKSGGEALSILEEIKLNPEAKNIKIIK